MASYGVFIAASGFHCHAPSGLMRFEPKLGAKDFAGPFVGAGAWGRFTQKHDPSGLSATLEVRYGTQRLARLEITPSRGKAAATSAVTLAGQSLDHRIESRDGRLAIVLAQPVTLSPGQTLAVRAGS